MNQDQILCADIQELVQQLNSKLLAARDAGLKVQLRVGSTIVGVRIWQETELLQVPPQPSLSDLIAKSSFHSAVRNAIQREIKPVNQLSDEREG